MSLVDQQKELEYYPDEVLAQEMMQPTGIAPSFLVATEIKRRNDMRNAYQSQMNPQPQTSVVEEEVMDLGGIPNVDPNAMQQQMMAQQGGMPPQPMQQPMPQQQMPQNAPMQMAEGGTISYDVEDGASVTVPDDEAGFLSAGLGAVGLLREGGNIRYQMGAGISPNVYAGQNVEDITDDEAGFFTEFWQSMSPAEKVTLAGSAALAAAPIPGGRIMAAMRSIPTIMKAYRAYKPLRTGLGKVSKPFYKNQPRNPQGRFSTDVEVGTDIGKKILTRGVPAAIGTGIVASNIDMGTPAESAEEVVEESGITLLPFDSASVAQPSSRTDLMEQLSSMLGEGGQSLRDQQGAALVQLGAGIAAGDLAGGLSAAGKEVSALKAARSAEKIQAVRALIEVQYKQGLIDVQQLELLYERLDVMFSAANAEPGSKERESYDRHLERIKQLESRMGGTTQAGLVLDQIQNEIL